MNKDIIKRIMNGDKASFKYLYDNLIDSALRTAFIITKNREIAKDAVQEAFIRVYINISSYDIIKPFEPWFYRILINECNRLLKKGSNLKLVDIPLLENDMIASKEGEDFSELYETIDSLSDIHRIPITLKYLQGFSEKEIAEVLDLNLNTVKSRLYKGREQLRIALENIEKGR